MPRRYRVALIPGDGIGPEIMWGVERLLDLLGVFDVDKLEAGREHYKRTGKPYPDDFFDRALAADAVIKGPLATPQDPSMYTSITVQLRRRLGVYADIRPFRSMRGVSRGSFDFVIVRESSEGLYSGAETRLNDYGFSVKIATRRASERIARAAFEYALRHGYRRVDCVHKATILRGSDGVFVEAFRRVASQYPGVEHGEILVDAAGYRIVKSPESLQVMVAPNLYGDILSDVAAGVVGSLGLCAAAELGEEHALFEPVHGAAFDIAGRWIANPVAALRAAQYMLEYLAERRSDESLLRAAKALSEAIERVVGEEGVRTPDIGGSAGTREVVEAVLSRLEESL